MTTVRKLREQAGVVPTAGAAEPMPVAVGPPAA
jgi:hypothetical protein